MQMRLGAYGWAEAVRREPVQVRTSAAPDLEGLEEYLAKMGVR